MNKELLEEINKGNISKIALFTQDESPILYTEKYVKEKDKEIERLNKELESLEKLNNANYQSFIEVNNIINELEKYLTKIKETSTPQERIMAKFVLEYIEELKGSDK